MALNKPFPRTVDTILVESFDKISLVFSPSWAAFSTMPSSSKTYQQYETLDQEVKAFY